MSGAQGRGGGKLVMSAGAFSQEPLSAGLQLELHEKLRPAYRRRLRAEVPRAADPHMPKQCSSVPPKLGDIVLLLLFSFQVPTGNNTLGVETGSHPFLKFLKPGRSNKNPKRQSGAHWDTQLDLQRQVSWLPAIPQ